MAEILVKIVRMGFSALAASVGENVAFRFDTLNIVQLPALWATNFDYLFCHIDSFPQFVILTNISDFKLHHYQRMDPVDGGRRRRAKGGGGEQKVAQEVWKKLAEGECGWLMAATTSFSISRLLWFAR